MAKRRRASLLVVLMCALLVVGLPSAGAAAPSPPPPGGPGDVSSSPPDLSHPSRPATPDELRQGRARLAPTTDTVVRDVIVSNTDTTLASGGSGGSEPSIAVNPANPNQMVISSFFRGWGANSSVFGSTDGGQSWTVYNTIPAPPGRSGVPGCPCDQTFDFGRDGTLYGTFLLADSLGNTNVVTGSTTDVTKTSSWSWKGNPVQLTNQAAANNADQPWLIVNRDPTTTVQDNPYVGYDEFASNLAQVAVSTGSTPVTITRDVRAGNESPNVTNPGLRLAADPRNGTMYAIYQTSTGFTQPRTVTYHLNRSTDAGQHWTLNGNADGLTVATVPSDQLRYKFGGVNDLRGGVDHAAVDPTNGDVFVVYGRDTAVTGVGNQLEIRRLTPNGSGGLTVGAGSVVTNASSAALPSVAVADDGTIGVLFDTFDGTTTDGFPIFSAHFSRSTDHGSTFTDQVLQTFNSPAKPSGSNTDRQRVFGDYQQLKAVGQTFSGVFSGNRAGFGGSTTSTIDPVYFRVRAPSTTTLTSSVNPSTFGQAVTFTAAVSSTAGTTPTGNVTFSSDGSPLGGAVGLTGGQATLMTSMLPAGTHTITADYGGDPNLAPSTGTLTQTVNKAATTTALTSSANPSAVGQAVTFTAAVSSTAGTTPTGNVTFASDGSPLGTVGLAGGNATLTTSGLSVGDHTISATYTADANFLTSDATLTQTVKPLAGLADPPLNPLMNALSNVIKDSAGNKIIGLDPPCAMTGPYQGLSNIDKLNMSIQANDGCLQFVTSY